MGAPSAALYQMSSLDTYGVIYFCIHWASALTKVLGANTSWLNVLQQDTHKKCALGKENKSAIS